MRSIQTFQYLLLAYSLLLEMGRAQGYIEDTEELLELQEHACGYLFCWLTSPEAYSLYIDLLRLQQNRNRNERRYKSFLTV